MKREYILIFVNINIKIERNIYMYTDVLYKLRCHMYATRGNSKR